MKQYCCNACFKNLNSFMVQTNAQFRKTQIPSPLCTFSVFVWWCLSQTVSKLYLVFTRLDCHPTIIMLIHLTYKIDFLLLKLIMIDRWGTFHCFEHLKKHIIMCLLKLHERKQHLKEALWDTNCFYFLLWKVRNMYYQYFVTTWAIWFLVITEWFSGDIFRIL